MKIHCNPIDYWAAGAGEGIGAAVGAGVASG